MTTLEQARDTLLSKVSKNFDPGDEKRSGYVDGVLDMFNAMSIKDTTSDKPS